MAEKDFRMPDLGEGLTESDLVSWQVAVGDLVELNQVIAEVETAKALVQVPSPFAGTVTRLHVEPGTTVQVGSPILSVDVASDAEADAGEAGGQETTPVEEPDTPTSAEGSGEPASAEPAPAAGGGRTSVLVGYGPRTGGSDRPRRRTRSAAWERDRREERTAPGTTTRDPAERPRSYPPVRKLAHDLGVDLGALTGTGPDGLITREDVVAWSERGGSPLPSNGRTPGAEPREERVPITGVRKHTAAAMVSSAFTAPHATEFLTVDVTETVDLVGRLRQDRRFAGTRVTVLTLVAKAVLVTLRRHPSLNARWDEEAGEIVRFRYVNLGIAAATSRGLMVPNVKDADGMDLHELADALGELTEAVRAGTTAPADLTGGTISITNIGVFGVDAGTPILNPGEAAILATGAVRRTPWEHRGEIVLRDVMTLSLSFDHRLVDGQEASLFLADVGRILASPGATLTLV